MARLSGFFLARALPGGRCRGALLKSAVCPFSGVVMLNSFVRAVLAASLVVFVAGCGDKPAETAAPVAAPANASAPDAAIRKSIDLLKQGDIAGLMQNAMPPADYEKVKADWSKNKDDKPITDEDRQKFAETMGKLTAPNAEQTLYAEIEPQLKAFDAQYQQQIPMYVAMGSSWLQGMVQQNKDLADADKQQALAAITALGNWVQKTRFTEPESVKKVLAIASKAARDVNLKTLDEAHALTFDQSMQKARIVFLAVKDALNVYGFSVDQTLDSVKPEIVSNDGKNAKVKLSYTLLDSPLSSQTEMVNVDGHWYGKNAIDKLHEHAAESPATPATDPAVTSPAKQG
jgi:mRNA-degrading endonuclease HigB of HigAB toxin-antitoxin module